MNNARSAKATALPGTGKAEPRHHDRPASHVPRHGRPQGCEAGQERAAAPTAHLGNMAIQQLLRHGVLQAKLAISHPGDAEEREADRVADQVVSAAVPGMVQHRCASCEAERVSRKTKAGPVAAGDLAPDGRAVNLGGGGQALPAAVRAYMEPRFGTDFSDVRVHTGGQASAMAEAIQARAFTLGRDVVFGEGEYAPDTPEGQRLLAHELTHVLQQGGASTRIQRKSKVQDAIDSGHAATVDELDHTVLQKATPEEKIAMIRLIIGEGVATHRLDLLWQGVMDPMVEANIGMWRATWELYPAMMENHPRKSQFTRDVAAVANAMLGESEKICEAYLQSYGLAADAKNAGVNTRERDASVNAVQHTAVEVMGAQAQLKKLWAVRIATDRKYLGYGSSMPGSYPFELDHEPMYASAEGLELWKKTNACVKDLISSIDQYLDAFPELYPLVMGGKSSKKDAYTDLNRTNLAATQPLNAIEQGLRETIANIRASKGPMVEILARDRKLGPVEQLLLSGERSAAGRNWKSGAVWSAMVPTITAKAGLVTPETVLMLALQIAVGVTTGGIGNLLLSGAQAALSYTEANVLQTASDTSLDAKGAIVGKQDVAAAKLSAAVDAAFLVLDLVPGFKQARGAWSGARGSAHAIESTAAELERKALQYEAKLMKKIDKAELEALQKEMQQQADAAARSLQDARQAAAEAQDVDKTLAEAELRKAEEAVARAQTSVRETKALAAGEVLVVGGERVTARGATAASGHTLEVTKKGIRRCSPTCPILRIEFASELADDAIKGGTLEKELAAAEELRISDPAGSLHAAQAVEIKLEGLRGPTPSHVVLDSDSIDALIKMWETEISNQPSRAKDFQRYIDNLQRRRNLLGANRGAGIALSGEQSEKEIQFLLGSRHKRVRTPEGVTIPDFSQGTDWVGEVKNWNILYPTEQELSAAAQGRLPRKLQTLVDQVNKRRLVYGNRQTVVFDLRGQLTMEGVSAETAAQHRNLINKFGAVVADATGLPLAQIQILTW